MHLFEQLLRSSDRCLKQGLCNHLLVLCLIFCLPNFQSIAVAEDMLEYQVKAAFIYNFIAFTQWPDNIDETINLCIYGKDYFGGEIDKLQSRAVNKRHIKIVRVNDLKELARCQAIFFSKSINNHLSTILSDLQNKPILTLADNPHALSEGIVINMNLSNEKIVFEINLGVARKSGLDISSKLLQLAVKVHQ